MSCPTEKPSLEPLMQPTRQSHKFVSNPCGKLSTLAPHRSVHQGRRRRGPGPFPEVCRSRHPAYLHLRRTWSSGSRRRHQRGRAGRWRYARSSYAARLARSLPPRCPHFRRRAHQLHPNLVFSSLLARYKPKAQAAQISLRHDPTSVDHRAPRGVYVRLPSPGLVNENSARETDSENPTFQDTPPPRLW